MSGVSSIGGVNNYSEPLSTGKKINSAADDASGLTIAEKLEKEKTGLEVGASNAKDFNNLINVADGALGGITDSLQRIREISLKAMNGINNASDLSSMQAEIDQLMKGIEQTSTSTEFNTHKLLDGSMATMDVALNPDGSGSSIQLVNSTLESLGIGDYNVTGDFDIDDIDAALDMVTEARSGLGASSNALEYAMGNNTNNALSTLSALSNTEDADMAESVTDQKKADALNEYKNMMLKNNMVQESLVTKIFQ